MVLATYNVSQYIEEALDSIIDQNCDSIQIIIVNDGSTDNTKEICEQYQQKYPDLIEIINKENGGVSSARNEGIKYAKGELLNFMDPDDKMGPNTLNKVWEYYQKIQNKTDVISIPIKQFGLKEGEYWQNFIFNKGTRVVNLFEDYEIMVSHTNSSFIKKEAIGKIKFEPNVSDGEDLKFLMDVLLSKMTIGLLDDCYYLYRVRNDGLLHTSHADYRWYFNYFTYLNTPLINRYNEKLGYVPLFAQYVLMSNIQWRFKEYTKFNEVINEVEFEKYKKVLFESLRYFSDEVILKQKNIDDKLKCYILSKKYNEKPLLIRSKNDIEIIVRTTKISNVSNQRIQLEFIQFSNDQIILDVSIVLFGIEPERKLVFTMEANKRTLYCRELSIISSDDEIFDEPASYKFRFKFIVPIKTGEKLTISNFGMLYDTYKVIFRQIKYGKFFPISNAYENLTYSYYNWTLSTKNNSIMLEETNKIQRLKTELKLDFEIFKSREKDSFYISIFRLFLYFYRRIKKDKHWLITDRVDKADDNGEAFFKYVLSKNEKKCYFAISNQSIDYQRIKNLGKIVDFFGKKYDCIYLTSSLIISSNNDYYINHPFDQHYFDDILYDIGHVFLQHGVTKDDVSNWLNKYHSNLNGIVISTQREYESFLKYDYYYDEKQLWLTGMPRYDLLYNNKEKIIAVMPTWRKYLNDYNDQGVWKGVSNFQKTEYYNFYNTLINEKKFIEYLKINGYKLLLVLHPNMQKYADLFDKNETIIIQKSNDVIYRDVFAKSAMLITDYSSVSFDFAYLKKPLIYCQFDKELIWSEAHIGKEGYFDYEKDGFGDVTYSLEDTIEIIKDYIKNDCEIKDLYLKRIMNFFKYSDNKNCERVYRRVSELERRINNGK